MRDTPVRLLPCYPDIVNVVSIEEIFETTIEDMVLAAFCDKHTIELMCHFEHAVLHLHSCQ